MSTALDQVSFPALGTTAVVLVSKPSTLREARQACERVVANVDAACSRFRDDSDLMHVNQRAGKWETTSATLLDALEVAIDAARTTDGLVDPTVGRAMCDIGYDRDFAEVIQTSGELRVALYRIAGWRCIELDRARSRVRIPKGVMLDLGATAKAWCADVAAHLAARLTGGGVAVGLGGDIAFAGTPPDGGWRVHVAEDHRASFDEPNGQTVSMRAGGIATSGTSVRRWTRGGEDLHHIVDPAQGRPAPDFWRSVSVAGQSCVRANVASTAAIVLGRDAPSWLAARNLPSRLVGSAGNVVYVSGWPSS